MQEIIINIMNEFGYLGLLLLIAIENVFPPIPSEVILPFSGFMTTKSNLTVLGVILVSTIGSIIGALVLYFVGNLLNRERLKKLVDGKIGKILHFKYEDIDKAYGWFENKGVIAVLLCRCVPIVRSLISIPAGMSGMNIGTFLIFTTLGTVVWNTVLVSLGAKAGASWENISVAIGEYSHIIKIAFVLIALILVFIYFRKKIIKLFKLNKLEKESDKE